MTNEEQRKMDLLRLERDELKAKVEHLERLDAAKLEGYIKNYEKLNENLLGTIMSLEMHVKHARLCALEGMQKKSLLQFLVIYRASNGLLSVGQAGRSAESFWLFEEEAAAVNEFEEMARAGEKK